MFWFLAAILLLLLGIFYWKSGGNMGSSRILNGEIVEVYPERRAIKVRYLADGQFIEGIAQENNGDFSRLQPGTKVLVNVDKATPHIPRGILYNIAGKNRTMQGAWKAAFAAAGICFVVGIISLLR